jgi:ClpP class serine protease
MLVCIGAGYATSRKWEGVGYCGIASINLHGTLGTTPSTLDSNSLAGEYAISEKITDQIGQADVDPSIKAIVLDVDSPGGAIGVTSSYLDQVNKDAKDGLTYHSISSGAYKDTGSPDQPLMIKLVGRTMCCITLVLSIILTALFAVTTTANHQGEA